MYKVWFNHETLQYEVMTTEVTEEFDSYPFVFDNKYQAYRCAISLQDIYELTHQLYSTDNES